MKQCKICLNADSCSFDWRDPDCEYMNCTEFKKPPLTNADRIRAMSDEELARKFADIEGEPYRWISIQAWLEWLKQECEN